MKDLEKVITKIKNLIELAQDKDDQEGIQSMLLARRLMLKHGIEQAQLEFNKSEVIKDMFQFNKNIVWWEKILVTIVSDNFRVKAFINRTGNNPSFVFMGMTDDVAIAKSVYEQLSVMIEHYANIFINRHYEETGEIRNRSITIMLKKSYITGFLSGLQKALKEQTAELMEEFAMVLVIPQEVTDEFNKMAFRKTSVSKPSKIHKSSYDKGYSRGREYRRTSGSIS